jgi:hypothetical protein
MIHDVWIHLFYGIFATYVLKFNTIWSFGAPYRSVFSLPSYKQKCYCIKIISTLICFEKIKREVILYPKRRVLNFNTCTYWSHPFQARTWKQAFLRWKVWFKTDINIGRVYFGTSTFVLLTLLIPALGSPLSNRCCRCAGIVLQNGCQVANRVTDVCGESVIHEITSEISKQTNRMCVCVCVWSGDH